MSMNKKEIKEIQKAQTNKLTAIALLSALIIVLQVLSAFIKFGPVNITLALTPIIIGAALYGPLTGAFLGCVMGVTVFVSGLIGLDGGFTIYLITGDFNAFSEKVSMSGGKVILPFILVMLLCIIKTTAAGYISGIAYKLLTLKKNKDNSFAATLVAGILCPIVNTGIFAVGTYAIFNKELTGMSMKFAGGQNTIAYLFLGIIGINFIIELVVNIVLSSAIARIIKVVSKKKS